MNPGIGLLAALAAPDRDGAHTPRVMVVGAHPDDETVGAGSRLERLRQGCFVCVTDGAPRDGRDAARHGLSVAGYAKARQHELEAALARCGIGAGQIERLACPDQQASLNMAPLATKVADLMLREHVQAVLTHSYEGGHPDHDATAFIVHAAAALLRGQGRATEIVEWTLYHGGPDGVLACAFLPSDDVDGQAVTLHLAPEERQRKSELVACHATQRETLRNLRLDIECYRPAPRYDFTRPPHPWKLHYENYPWGMTGERFGELAAEAMAQLGLEGRL